MTAGHNPSHKTKRTIPDGMVLFWRSERDLNYSFLDCMELMKLLCAQNAYFTSNIPIFLTVLVAQILLRVF